MEGKAETQIESKAEAQTPVKTIEQNFLEEKFKLYYQLYLKEPKEIARREFGFGFQKKIDLRHYSFINKKYLLQFIEREKPKYISYSAAYYNAPHAKPMDRKELLGMDLIFDLDAQIEHENHNQIYCLECIEQVKGQAITLMEEFLFKDFGLAESEVRLNFSGSKGFHFHIDSEKYKQLPKNARREIVEYISGKNISFSAIVKKRQVKLDGERTIKTDYQGPTKESKGWKARIYNDFYNLIANSTAQELKKFGFPGKKALEITEERQRFLGLIRNGGWGFAKEETFDKIISRRRRLMAAESDAAVTFDMHRLIRLEDSLHGDTGFIAKVIPVKELQGFQPLQHAIAFKKGEVGVIPMQGIQLNDGDEKMELKKGEKASVSTAIAMLLFAKKAALLG